MCTFLLTSVQKNEPSSLEGSIEEKYEGLSTTAPWFIRDGDVTSKGEHTPRENQTFDVEWILMINEQTDTI